MGILRKTMSVGTLGLVSYRSQGERATKIAKQTRNAARAMVVQQGVNLEIQRQQQAQLAFLNAQAQARRWEAEAQEIPPRPVILPPQAIAPRPVVAPPKAVAGPPPAGWYRDPQGPRLRWWDGHRWTEYRH